MYLFVITSSQISTECSLQSGSRDDHLFKSDVVEDVARKLPRQKLRLVVKHLNSPLTKSVIVMSSFRDNDRKPVHCDYYLWNDYLRC